MLSVFDSTYFIMLHLHDVIFYSNIFIICNLYNISISCNLCNSFSCIESSISFSFHLSTSTSICSHTFLSSCKQENNILREKKSIFSPSFSSLHLTHPQVSLFSTTIICLHLCSSSFLLNTGPHKNCSHH